MLWTPLRPFLVLTQMAKRNFSWRCTALVNGPFVMQSIVSSHKKRFTSSVRSQLEHKRPMEMWQRELSFTWVPEKRASVWNRTTCPLHSSLSCWIPACYDVIDYLHKTSDKKANEREKLSNFGYQQQEIKIHPLADSLSVERSDRNGINWLSITRNHPFVGSVKLISGLLRDKSRSAAVGWFLPSSFKSSARCFFYLHNKQTKNCTIRRQFVLIVETFAVVTVKRFSLAACHGWTFSFIFFLCLQTEENFPLSR